MPRHLRVSVRPVLLVALLAAAGCDAAVLTQLAAAPGVDPTDPDALAGRGKVLPVQPSPLIGKLPPVTLTPPPTTCGPEKPVRYTRAKLPPMPKFKEPTAVVVDAAGAMYVASTGENAIWLCTPTGSHRIIAGNGAVGYLDGAGGAARLNAPSDLALSPDGRSLYVADTGNHAIRRIELGSGFAVTTWAGGKKPARTPFDEGWADGLGSAAAFDQPMGLAAARTGELFVGDSDNHQLRQIDRNRQVKTLAGVIPTVGSNWVSFYDYPEGYRVQQVAIDPNLLGWNQDEAYGSADGPSAATKAQLRWPTKLAADGEGGVYIADTGNDKLRYAKPDGRGGASLYTVASAPFVTGVALRGPCYLVYVSAAESRVYGLSLAAGGKPEVLVEDVDLVSPRGIAVDSKGNLYVADAGSEQLLMFRPAN